MLRATSPSTETQNVSMLLTVTASICLIWFVVVWCVCAIGVTQLFRYYWTTPEPAVCLRTLKEEEIPHVTIIRPVRGLDPRLYECLAATCRQTYPRRKLEICLCVPSRSDAAFPILERLVREFPELDLRILVEEEDPMLKENVHALGPNPKIRNMSRAYREAKGDIVWVLDCNVWLGKGVCGRMVDLLCGYGGQKKYKFVHQTPISVDLDGQGMSVEERKELLGGLQETVGDIAASTSSDPRNYSRGRFRKLLQRGGGRLDEAFMSSAHAKFYLAINTVAVAPCVMGKSTMFRKSHLNFVTASNPERNPGIDFFSDNICEDHLIGDALWKQPQAFEKPGYRPAPGEVIEKYGKHCLLRGDMCFQPISHTSVAACIARRIRWLRVRKFTVTLATFVEPGTESILCSLYGAFALTTLPFATRIGIPPTWSSFLLIWLLSMSLWCIVDFFEYLLLHSAKTVELDAHTPDFVRPSASFLSSRRNPQLQPLLGKEQTRQPSLMDGYRRSFSEFWCAWMGREISALPIWVWAFWGGVTVEWRGRRFWVGVDMKVHEIKGEAGKAVMG